MITLLCDSAFMCYHVAYMLETPGEFRPLAALVISMNWVASRKSLGQHPSERSITSYAWAIETFQQLAAVSGALRNGAGSRPSIA